MHTPATAAPLSASFNRRHLLAGLASAGLAPWLTACGGGSGDDAQLRVVNATQGLSKLDAYLGTTALGSSIESATASAYSGHDAGSYTLGIRSAGSAVNSLETTISLSKSTYATAVVMGGTSSLNATLLTENESDPSSGYAKVRLINALQTGDSVDLYITSASADLASESAAISSVTKGNTSAFRSVAKGSYRIRVTTAGDKSDVRADLGTLTLSDKAIVTLVLVPTHSPRLGDLLALPQKDAGTRYASTLTRLRFVNAAASGTSAQPQLDGANTASAIGGYGVSSYSQTSAGTRTLGFVFNGQTVAVSTALPAGYDMTVALVLDASGSPAIVGFTDDNFPSASSTKSKVRLVHLATGAGSAQLTYNGGSLLADYTAERTASDYTAFTAGEYDFAVAASSGGSQTVSSYTTTAAATYTAFAFGAGTVAKLTLRQDE